MMLTSAIERDGESGADGHAVDRRHDRRVAVDHRAHDVACLAHHADRLFVVADLPGDPVQVATGRERPAGAGDHDGAHRRVVVDRAEHARQLEVHVGAGGVQAIGIVEGDQQHPVARPLETQLGVGRVRIGGFVHGRAPY